MTNQTNSQPTNPTTDNKKFLPAAIIGGVVLFAIIGFLAFTISGKNSEIDQKVAELEEVESLRIELETQFNDAIVELETVKAENGEMATLIDAQKAELEEQRSKIAGMISNGKKLKSARAELEKMKNQMAEYRAEIEELVAANAVLTDENTQLTADKEELNNEVMTQGMEIVQLNEAQAVLVSEKINLMDENDELSKKVNLASVIHINKIDVDGIKEKGSGKTATRKSAKSIDRLRVCFEASANEITEAGTENFFVRIINPRGETLALEANGSGSTVDAKTGEIFRFTKAVETNYANKEANLCMSWRPSQAFDSGKYKVEIYNKGHLAGKTQFELK